MKRWPHLLVVLVAVGASLVLSGVRLSRRLSEPDLDAAAAAVRAQYREGDLVVVTPYYISGPRERLGDLPLLSPRQLDVADLRGYARVQLLELDVTGATSAFRELLSAQAQAQPTATFGRVRLTTFVRAPAERRRFDLGEQVAALQVTAHYADGLVARCDKFERDRWLCPRDASWSYVGREVVEIDDDPRACVWLHPLPKGGELHVVLPDTAFVPNAHVTGGMGFAASGAKRVQAPVEVRLLAGEQELMRREHPAGSSYTRYDVALPAEPVPLTLVVTSENNGAAHFCLSLSTVEAL